MPSQALGVPIALVRRLGCLGMGQLSPCSVGSSEALGAKLEPSKERGVFCPVLTVAPFSLPTKCPFVCIRAKCWTEADTHPQTHIWGRRLRGWMLACVSLALRWPGTLSSSWSRPTSPRAVCLGFCAPPGSAAQPREVLGLAYRLSWPGSCPCPTPEFPGCASSRKCPCQRVPLQSHRFSSCRLPPWTEASLGPSLVSQLLLPGPGGLRDG